MLVLIGFETAEQD